MIQDIRPSTVSESARGDDESDAEVTYTLLEDELYSGQGPIAEYPHKGSRTRMSVYGKIRLGIASVAVVMLVVVVTLMLVQSDGSPYIDPPEATRLSVNNKLWSAWTDGIAKFLQREIQDSSAKWMLAATPVEAPWRGSHPQFYSMYFLDNKPEWGPTHHVTGARISDGYGIILDELKKEGGEKPADFTAVEDAFEQARSALAEFNNKWQTEWLFRLDMYKDPQFPPHLKKDYNHWMVDHGYDLTLAHLEDGLRDAYDKYKAALDKYVGSYSDVTDAMLSYTSETEYVETPYSGYARMRTYSFSPDPITVLDDWSKNKNKKPLNLSARDTDEQLHYAGKTWSSNTSDNEGDWLQIVIENLPHTASVTTYTVSMSAEAYEVIRVTPGSWYDRQLLINHIDGEWEPSSPIALGRTEAWGKGGVFPFEPKYVVLGYNVGYTVQVEKDIYTAINDEVNGDKKVDRVCVFDLCHIGGETKTTWTQDPSTNTIGVKSSDNVPRVLAVGYDTVNVK
eukprot:GFYU01011571.1.p1 GENE.GFYU01011571.1~~GFYU01011571.1.p1  ORF type:complete len:509 (+),score=106.67 GFYU01011571.1:149-1675(+)